MKVEEMSTLVLADPLSQPAQCLGRRDHANLALGCILDAEIAALKDRLRLRSASSAGVWGLARADLDRQVAWLRNGLAKLQARRDTLDSSG